MKDAATSEPLDELMAQIDKQRQMLDRQMRALRDLRLCQANLQSRGFRTEISHRDGRLRLDCDLAAPRALLAPEGPPAALPATPAEPEAVRPAPEPKKPTAEPEPEYVTGPFSAEEKVMIIDLTLQGQGPSAIARRLDRRTKEVSNWKYRHQNKIEKAHRARDRTTPDPAPAEAVPEPPAPDPASAAHTTTLSGRERAIDSHLNALGYAGTWTSARDLQLVIGVARGDGIDKTAAALPVERSEALARWRALNTDPGNLDHQTALLHVLKLRAE